MSDTPALKKEWFTPELMDHDSDASQIKTGAIGPISDGTNSITASTS